MSKKTGVQAIIDALEKVKKSKQKTNVKFIEHGSLKVDKYE